MILFRIFAILAAGSCFVGYLGALHPAFDSISIGRPIAAFGLLLSWFALPAFLRWFGLALSAFILIPFGISLIHAKHIENPALTVYQHNLLFTNTAPDLKLVTDQLKPDVITLQEIKAARQNVLDLSSYPNQIICQFEAVGDVAVLSKHPFVAHGCSEGVYRGFAWARIKNEVGKELTIVSIHTHWPYPYGQAKQLAELIPQLEKLPRPIVLAGDFNQVTWSHAVSSLANAVGGKAIDQTILTLVRPPLFLPIDHVIAPQDDVSISRLDRYGSDHNGLFAYFQKWPK